MDSQRKSVVGSVQPEKLIGINMLLVNYGRKTW